MGLGSTTTRSPSEESFGGRGLLLGRSTRKASPMCWVVVPESPCGCRRTGPPCGGRAGRRRVTRPTVAHPGAVPRRSGGVVPGSRMGAPPGMACSGLSAHTDDNPDQDPGLQPPHPTCREYFTTTRRGPPRLRLPSRLSGGRRRARPERQPERRKAYGLARCRAPAGPPRVDAWPVPSPPWGTGEIRLTPQGDP
jgi:hypothetical protein